MKKDEYGQYLCPLSDGEMQYDEAAEDYKRVDKACDVPLHIVLSGYIPVHDELVDVDMNNAVATSWTVECENGHVLLRSAGEETAEPFKLSYLRGVLERRYLSHGS